MQRVADIAKLYKSTIFIVSFCVVVLFRCESTAGLFVYICVFKPNNKMKKLIFIDACMIAVSKNGYHKAAIECRDISRLAKQ